MGDQWLTLEQVQTELGCSRPTLTRLIAAGRLRSIKHGRSRRVPASYLAEYKARVENDNAESPDSNRHDGDQKSVS